MTREERLAAIEARLNATTPGPWSIVLGSGNNLCTTVVGGENEGTVVADCLPDWVLASECAPEDHVPNMNFIVESRADVEWLIAELRAALKRVATTEHHDMSGAYRGRR